MKILAIETSVPRWSVALLDDETVLVQPKIDPAKPISRGLLSVIQTAIDEAGWNIRQIEMIGVTQGPGAFTGLRVGVTAAKTLAYALSCPLVACNSLEVIASNTAQSKNWSVGQTIIAIMDAQRSEFIVGFFRAIGPWQLEYAKPSVILNADGLVSELSPAVILTGPGLTKWSPPSHSPVADPSVWTPNAEVLGRLALHRFNRGLTCDPFGLAPEYFRPSYAEEKKPAS